MRETYEQVVKSTNGAIVPQGLKNAPANVGAFGYVLQWYLSFTRCSEFTYSELAAWASLNHIELTPLEVELLSEINAKYKEVNSDRYSKPKG